MMVDILDPTDEDYIIDPSCGSGGFLVETLRHIWAKLDAEGEKYHWNQANLREEKMEVALNKLCGIDKDYFLSKVAKAYMAILGDGKSGIFCEDSLDKNTGNWIKGSLKEKESPQVLFIERDIQLLADYGRMAIVLPDGVFGNDTFGYIRHWLKEQGRILAVIDIPIETFQPNTSTKTSVLVFQKLPKDKIPEEYDIFMAIANTCGHDRRGNQIYSDEIQLVADEYKKWASAAGLTSQEE